MKPKKGQKISTGQASVAVVCAVSGGEVILAQRVRGRWNGAAAVKFYNSLVKTLRRRYPKRSRLARWTVLEDNDPSGFKNGVARKAKKRLRIDVMEQPRRSPDLNVLDYFVWSRAQQRLRKQEKAFPEEYVEPREEFWNRLRRTLLRVNCVKAVKDMKRRTRLLHEASGGLFEE